MITCLEAEAYYDNYDDLAEKTPTGGERTAGAEQHRRRATAADKEMWDKSRPLNSPPGGCREHWVFWEGDPGVSSQRLLIALWLI